MNFSFHSLKSDPARRGALTVLFILICALVGIAGVLIGCGLAWIAAWSWNASVVPAWRGESVGPAGGAGLICLMLLASLASALVRRVLR